MSPVAVLFNAIADRFERRAGHRFSDHPVTACVPHPAGLSTPGDGAASTAVAPGPAGTPTRDDRPLVGAGPNHVPGCAYTDDDGHRCVTETGQPSSVSCWATDTRAQRTPKEVA